MLYVVTNVGEGDAYYLEKSHMINAVVEVIHWGGNRDICKPFEIKYVSPATGFDEKIGDEDTYFDITVEPLDV